MRSLPWHRSVAPILCNNGLATLAESFDKQSHEAPVARTVNTLFQNFRFGDFDMHHQGRAPSKCHACRKRFCNGPWWSVHARGRPIKTPCMEFHQNQCFPKVLAYPERDSLNLHHECTLRGVVANAHNHFFRVRAVSRMFHTCATFDVF